MKKTPQKPNSVSQKDWADLDSPEATEADFANMRPAREAHPDIVAAYKNGALLLPKRHRGPNKAPIKKPVSILFSPVVADTLRAQGKGWQPRLDHLLQYLIKTGQFEKLERKAEKQLSMAV